MTRSPPILRWSRACLGTLLLILATLCTSAASPKQGLLIHSFGPDFTPFNTLSGVLRSERVSQSSEPVDVFEVSLGSARSGDTTQEGPLVDYLVGCGVGFCLLLLGGRSDWLIPFALAATVLISSYIVRIKTMWRQAPITAAVVIAAGLAGSTKLAGVECGLHKVAEVIFGCLLGITVSWLMSKGWLVRPKESSNPDRRE